MWHALLSHLLTSTPQRIKGAIDRTIAEEQARQKTFAQKDDQPTGSASRRSGSISRTSSTAKASQAGSRKPRAKRPSEDLSKDANGDGGANPDPAVFEAAFVIDDDDVPPTSTSTPAPSEKEELKEEGTSSDKASDQDGKKPPNDGPNENGESTGGDSAKAGQPADGDKPVAAAPELPPDVRQKLKKLEKLEKTYPGKSASVNHTGATRHGPAP